MVGEISGLTLSQQDGGETLVAKIDNYIPVQLVTSIEKQVIFYENDYRTSCSCNSTRQGSSLTAEQGMEVVSYG